MKRWNWTRVTTTTTAGAMLLLAAIATAPVAQAQDGTGIPSRSSKSPNMPPRDNQTTLRIQRWFAPTGPSAAHVTVTVNGQSVLETRNTAWSDISRVVGPGENTIVISGENTGAVVTVSHADKAGQFRRIAQFRLTKKDAARLGGKGRSQTFLLPGARGEIGKTAPRTGSTANQVVLRIGMGGNNPITLYINDKKAGDFQTIQNLDISNLVRKGDNSVRLEWQSGTWGILRISQSRGDKRLRELTALRIARGSESRVGGQKRVTFSVGGG